MTQNATAYFNVVELGRSNRANEAETHRRNLESERHNRNVLAETYRHNLATEQLQRDQYIEAARHNLMQENINWRNIDVDWAKLAETARANRAHEAELRRSHLVSEQETLRHNRHTEMSGYINSAGGFLRGVGSVMSGSASRKQAAVASRREKWEKRESGARVVQGYLRSASDFWGRANETGRLALEVGKNFMEGKTDDLLDMIRKDSKKKK